MAKNDRMYPPQGKWDRYINALGIVSAMGIAFGGLFLVRNRLMEEEEKLLESSGKIEISVQTLETVKQAELDEETRRESLTAEELTQILGMLEGTGEAYLHEPLQGQLSMSEAIEYGREWLENFLMPHLGAGEYVMSQEYRANCYLLALQGDSSENDVEEELLSYWMVMLYSRNVEAGLILNAVTGQVLNASIDCLSPIEYLEGEGLRRLLEDYADSFGLESKSAIVSSEYWISEAGGRLMFQEVGDTGIFAAVRTSSIVVGSSSAGAEEYQEFFNIQLYLNLNIY